MADIAVTISSGSIVVVEMDRGYSGYSGKSGHSGYSGTNPGASGYSGYSGKSGYSGVSGKSGYSGASGFSGYSGRSAYSGYSGAGTSGFSGYSGISGFSGYSGKSGFSGYSGAVNYTEYRALLTQTSTNAPVATVLVNTLGGAVVWARSSTGVYTATLSTTFTTDKTFVFTGSTASAAETSISDNQILLGTVKTSTSVVTLYSKLANFAVPEALLDDGLLSSTEIHILVFP